MAATFGRFTLDTRTRQALVEGTPVHLSPKAFDLLALLVARRPEAVPKGEIHAELWPDTFVSDVNVPVLIAEIRTALGDDAREPAFIRTVQRFGYAFIAEASAAVPPPAACWVSWRGGRVVLNPGENVLGRDPSADVRVDAVGVSRRHAVIVVNGDTVLLQDLSSKNGTFVDDRRISTPVSLGDGSEIRIGPIPLTFRRVAVGTSTQTVPPALSEGNPT